MANTNPTQRVVIGAFILIIGLLALIDKLNLFEVTHLFQFWPTVFVVIGILKIMQSKNRPSLFLGTGFIALGVVMTLNNLGIIDVSWNEWWPVILIIMGLSIIFKDHRHKDLSIASSMHNSPSAADSFLDITVLMSGNKTVSHSQDFKGGDVTAIMGGVELDLRDASIQSDVVIDLFVVCGGIVLKIPADWAVVNRSTAIMGGIDDKSVAPPASNKRLIVMGTAIMGGVEIKN